MNLLLFHIPLIAAGVVVGGVVIASGGSGLQSGVAAIATGASGFATSALLIQSQSSKQGKLEQERDRLKQDIERQIRALPFGAELEYLQRQRELLRQNVSELKQQEEDLQERVRLVEENPPNLEELEQRQQKIGELKTQINENKGRLQAIIDQIAEREKQRDGLQEVTSQFLQKQEEVRGLTERLHELNQQAAELELFRSTYDALRKDAQNLETKQQHLQAEIPRLEQERDRILAEIATMETKAQQVDGLRVQIENLDADLRTKRSELGSLKRQLEQLNSEKSLLDGQILSKENELKEFQKKIREAKGDLEEIENGFKQAFQALETPIELAANQPRLFASETEFLTLFRQYLNGKGLIFSERTVKAFHTSLKVQDISALVILAGISGTGKSERPQAYANFIGAPLVMLPVQPRWDSPQDLQGFYNYVEKKYKPTDLMRYLYQHQHQSNLKGRIVMVLLDEMNLARVEYYFSDFLSKLETRRSKKTYLDLEAGSLKLKDEQKQVLIPNEFLFVGTMNEDETTQSLSDKVLDRANILTFGRPPDLQLCGHKQTSPPIPTYVSWDAFQGWTKEPSPDLAKKVKHYVDEANDIMESLGRPFAHRVFQAFTKYVCNYPNPDRDEVIRNQAIADQFGQKLLPKLRGVMVEEKNVKEALDKMESLLSQLNDEPLNQAFKKAREGQYGQFQWKGMVYPQD
ncbi:MAG: AAA family ATPase [Microcystis sp.]|uniref:AAA family ATPase n=1 Tax=Microcystis sp. TaxID=1127 RepID=UPI00391FB542